jgi:hypothetical protein
MTDHPASHPGGGAATLTSDALALRSLWSRLGRGEHPLDAMRSLAGVPEESLRDLALLWIATTSEAAHLIETTPELLRALASTTTMRSERCVGNVQGPVLWSETLNARAHTMGGDDVFVCGVQSRDFDVAENRVLLGALDLLTRSASVLEGEAASMLSPGTRALIRQRADEARRLRGDRHLEGVRRGRVARNSMQKVERSRRARHYAPAAAVMHRRTSPFDAATLVEVVDPATASQLRALELVLGAIERRSPRRAPLRCDGIEAMAGPVRYRNWRRATGTGRHGIRVGDLLVDGPETNDPEARSRMLDSLADRAAGQQYCLVATPEEAEIAVELALGA